MNKYLLEGYICIIAENEDEAVAKMEEAGMGCDVEIIPGIFVDFQGPWDAVEEIYEPPCTCPPSLIERGGWTSTCEMHG